ncbi:serine/threonine protein kinase [Asanoa ishikariensis]|uniref:non-specific serine/threonine protein kinase n=1 Tax=Asanoa ishikariensis TaxID=137265 RepID=A0A1H3LU27_9ACTN|nr:serine/threonine-protein kinase [Asanoa ishikariensis]GIF65695.1 serine/threonine protein kinase [Asanoa ishikariensis]SDY67830.1 serine/threonine protein kinase [Asanoa ishikariensis]
MGAVGGRYRLVERLGAGGMSVVWRGYDEVLGRQVAVKVLAPSLAADPAFRERIRTEAQAAARLSHPHITNVYDYGESGGVPYVVMELVDGVPLAACATPMPWRDAVGICAEVASALAAAHARGVVHRDVTPSNVLLTAAGAKVLDFGISAVVGEQEVGPDGSLLGTPAYIAPERLDGGQVAAAADVYGLGLLLYRCLAGRLPWPGRSSAELLRSHLYAEPLPLPDLDGLPTEVAELCLRCLAKAPGERPTSAEVVDVLAGITGHLPRPVSPAPAGGDSVGNTTILPRTDEPASRGVVPAAGIAGMARPGDLLAGRRRQVLVTAAAVVALGVGGAAFATTRGGDEPAGATTTTALAAPAAAADKPACEVRYALRRDSGKAFDADLTVVNGGPAAVSDWSLTFTFPGDQKLTRAGSAKVDQQGSAVVLRPAASTEVPVGGSAGMRLTGSYARSNAFPVEFRLDGEFCAPRLSTVTTTTPTTKTQTAKTAVRKPAAPSKPKPPKAKDEPGGKGPGPKSGKGPHKP